MAEPETNLDFLDAGVDMHALDDVSPTDAPTVLDRLGPAHFRSKGFSFMGFLQTVYDHVAEQSKRGGPPPAPEGSEEVENADTDDTGDSDGEGEGDSIEPESREPSLVEAVPAVTGLFGATSIAAAGLGDTMTPSDVPPEPAADHVAILSDRLEAENAVEESPDADADDFGDEDAPTHIAANASDIVEINAADIDSTPDESPRKADEI